MTGSNIYDRYRKCKCWSYVCDKQVSHQRRKYKEVKAGHILTNNGRTGRKIFIAIRVSASFYDLCCDPLLSAVKDIDFDTKIIL